MSEWDGEEGDLRAAPVAGAHGVASPGRAPKAAAPAPQPARQRRVIIRPEESIDDETLWKGPSRMDSDDRSGSYHVRYRAQASWGQGCRRRRRQCRGTLVGAVARTSWALLTRLLELLRPP